ncbi:MAG: hypothetical protein H6739_15080 [Alphaproteobacteria bacterium]|nr:hypothetical protein [Alphaproteobacteria bacterium]
MTDAREILRAALPDTPMVEALLPVLTGATGTTSAGYPYLQPACYARLRDRVPLILAWGPPVLAETRRIAGVAEEALGPGPALDSVQRAARVVQQVAHTAAITAPTDLWLLRHVLSTWDRLGLSDRLLAGKPLDPQDTRDRDGQALRPDELRADLDFLQSRGLLVAEAGRYRLSDDPTARRAVDGTRALAGQPAGLSGLWRRALQGEPLAEAARALLEAQVHAPPSLPPWAPGGWLAGPEAIELGARLVPLVLGLRAAGRIQPVVDARRLDPTRLPLDPALFEGVRGLLAACGVLDDHGALSLTGARTLRRGPGPFGIIEAYHPYLDQLDDILRRGRSGVHLARGANIAASQDANRRTFQRANDALDRFCADTGFRYRVFVEHAIGRGEATRQRYERSGDALAYVGADLEDPTIDAAMAEQRAGRLPADMLFVRRADIGQPQILVEAMGAAGLDTEGAVMVVGNGFHEVRGQTDARMIEVFQGYERAGFVLLFTEESALAVPDLLETAWNTYHAGFRYVHARSGQGLRPASPVPEDRRDASLPASWTECAEAAGYVRAEDYGWRSRTIYPIPPEGRHNPSISVNHFFVPRRVADRLGMTGPGAGG